ncbi:MAG: hypothetical protein Q9227_001083 [Pyrenula ochraceoflavens]
MARRGLARLRDPNDEYMAEVFIQIFKEERTDQVDYDNIEHGTSRWSHRPDPLPWEPLPTGYVPQWSRPYYPAEPPYAEFEDAYNGIIMGSSQGCGGDRTKALTYFHHKWDEDLVSPRYFGNFERRPETRATVTVRSPH